MTILLILGSIVDLLLAALLVGVSGFVFGGGPAGGYGEITGVVMWSFGMLVSLLCPAAGFVLRGKGQPGAGASVAWSPPLAALLVTFVPYHPY